MNEYRKPHEVEAESTPSGHMVRRWLVICAILLGAACGALGYGYRQHIQALGTAAQADELRGTVNQLQDQIKLLNSKLSELTAAQEAAARAAAPDPVKTAHPAKRVTTTKRRAPANNALHELQARLEAQQQELAAVRGEMAKTRSDLQGNIDSTRDELNGSIAKTHDELVALEKRGERNYYEFDVTKSKEFQRFGPLMLCLRKADTKHKSYDLNLIVEDNHLSKKHVDLYEPIWLNQGGDVQPMQVVVMEIDKDRVHGYVSAPKYTESRQTRSAPGPAVAPASSPSQSNPAGTSSSPTQPNQGASPQE